MARMELADPIADECLPGRRDDQMQLVFVVVVPARQRRRKAVVQAAYEAGVFGRLVAELAAAPVLELELGLALARQLACGNGVACGHGGLPSIHHTTAIGV